jgi:predicted nucleotidyltransferase component of viral defense system
MIEWLALSEQQRKIMLDQAAQLSGITAKAIEKDWWVTLTLKALFQTPYAVHLAFKGGTSLSKCWNLIERFSEDIDLAVDTQVFGLPVTLTSLWENQKTSTVFQHL